VRISQFLAFAAVTTDNPFSYALLYITTLVGYYEIKISSEYAQCKPQTATWKYLSTAKIEVTASK
jgi:hypothetical protein